MPGQAVARSAAPDQFVAQQGIDVVHGVELHARRLPPAKPEGDKVQDFLSSGGNAGYPYDPFLFPMY
jgi:hypothetical protein